MSTPVKPLRTTCSECLQGLALHLDKGYAVVRIPPRGEGDDRIPGRLIHTDLTVTTDGLVIWDCPWPGCDFVDATYEAASDLLPVPA